MPYISDYRREELDYFPEPHNVGELNFAITKMVLKYLGPSPRYEDFNAVMGVLACSQQELYRRAVSPYEDEAAKRNGDLPWPPL